jgi:hypothetical protein
MSSDTAGEVRAWTRARDSGPQTHNEDAVRIEGGRAAGGSSVFVAIADGVSAAPFSGEWARALVDAASPAWLDDDRDGDLMADIDVVRRGFDPMADVGDEGDFVLEDLWRERGSAATLLLVELVAGAGSAHLRAAAVGDTVVLVSDAASVVSFPVGAAADFTSRPRTVRTGPDDVVVQRWSRDVPPGSWVAMASDGVGAWMLGLAEDSGARALYEWLGAVDDDSLPAVDDDLTLVLLRVPDRAPMTLWQRVVRFVTRV